MNEFDNENITTESKPEYNSNTVVATVNANIIEGEPTKTPTAPKYELHVARKIEKASHRKKASKIAHRERKEEEQQEYYEIKKILQGGRDQKNTESLQQCDETKKKTPTNRKS